jgi:hypothetical protein
LEVGASVEGDEAEVEVHGAEEGELCVGRSEDEEEEPAIEGWSLSFVLW